MTNSHFMAVRCFCLALFIMLPITSVAVKKTESNLLVSIAIPSSNGLLVGFTVSPQDCLGNFKTMHALLPNTHENYNKYSIKLLRNRALKKTVTINYIDKGDCTTADTVLEITAIK